MDKTTALAFCQDCATRAWAKIHSLFGDAIGEFPIVEINTRLRTTAGMAYNQDKPARVQFAYKLLIEFPEQFESTVIPHELLHVAAYRVFGDKGHGKPWKYMMAQYGLPTSPYHDLIDQLVIRNAARAEGIPIPRNVTLRRK